MQNINKTFKATLTQGKEGHLTLRLFGLSEDDRHTFLIDKGEQPKNMIKLVVM